MKLYSYWRSSAAYRVRIALYYKNIAFEYLPVHLLNQGVEQYSQAYSNVNPCQLVPTLLDGDLAVHQSLAIIDYLEDLYPNPALYPTKPSDKAQVKALSLDIISDLHPLNNLRVQNYLKKQAGFSEQQKLDWSHYWMIKGFDAIEKQLKVIAGEYCFADQLTVADICLVPQVYNAERFSLDMSVYPLIMAITERCRKLPEFMQASPEKQIDAVN